MKFHHIGIIVKDIKSTLFGIKKILNAKKMSKIYVDKKWKVKVIFIKHHKNIIFEIIHPLNNQSPVSKSLKKNINILNHVAFTCKNFDKDKKNIIDNGGMPVTAAIEAVAFKKKKFNFF